MSEEKKDIFVNGVYKHFKGGIYTVLFAGTDVDSMEKKIIYINQETQKVWIRSYDEFVGFKLIDGEQVERFEFLGMPAVDQFLLEEGE